MTLLHTKLNFLISIGIGILFTLVITACEPSADKPTMDVSSLMGGEAEEGYARAIEPRQFIFPADHASHPDFRNEWWYITGNLSSDEGHEFGYQVTLFRIALTPQNLQNLPRGIAQSTSRKSNWANRHVWMGHVALTDITHQEYHYGQRFARNAVGLAGFQQQPFKVWLEDWQILGAENGQFPWKVNVKHKDFTLDLDLTPAKNIVLQGDKGLSQKSSEKGNASYYYSITHLQTKGQVTVAGQQYQVKGKSWLDREWSTSALGKDQKGWDWFSLQFDEGVELMYYQMRKKSGDVDVLSSGKIIKPDGGTTDIVSEDIELTPLKIWTSKEGRKYPIVWQMRLPKVNKSWRIEARVDNQEMSAGIQYWEGAVQIIDETADEKTEQVIGKGYLEMTGY